MEIRRIEKVNEDTGEMEILMALSREQTQVLLEYALNLLAAQGLVTFVTGQASATPEEAQKRAEAAMEAADPKDLPQA